MKPTCQERYYSPDHPNERFCCTKPSGHDMGHLTYIAGQKYGWVDKKQPVYAYLNGRCMGLVTPEEEKPEYTDWFTQEYKAGVLGVEWPDVPAVKLELTLTDLKTIAYYMAEEEDADKTKTKIDKALKELL